MGYVLAVSLATRLRINAKSTTELNDAFGEVVKIVKEDVPAWDVQSVTHGTRISQSIQARPQGHRAIA